MPALAASPLTSSPRASTPLSWDSLLTSKKLPHDPDANEPGTMPDEDLAIESPEYEDDDDFDMAPHPYPDENLMDDDPITPENTPRAPR